MRLAELIADTPVLSLKGVMPEKITGITKDSREVKEGFVFFATESSRSYVDEATKKGAAAIISDAEPAGNLPCLVIIKEPRLLLGRMAARFYGYPSRSMHIIGVTGTNGKTTVTYIIESILRAASESVGVMGTITYRYNGQVLKGQTTTPESTDIQRLFADMKAAGTKYVAMEVSSHALDQGRVEGVEFDGAIFTNLTHDHLDYHRDFDDYRDAKKRLFHQHLQASSKENRYAILNIDDPVAAEFSCEPPVTDYTYSVRRSADAHLTSFHEDISGLRLGVSVMGKQFSLRTGLLGIFNAANILAAGLFGHAAGIPVDTIREGVESLRGVPGRLERVENERGIPIFVDYAHTPDALRKTLGTLKALTGGRLVVVFGCGGERDRAKRPVMGRIASELADFAIITSDNPRREDPKTIIEEIRRGVVGNAHHIIEDRREAIAEAIRMATNRDVVIVAGKGHEDYQIIGTEIHRFSDREVIEGFFNVAA